MNADELSTSLIIALKPFIEKNIKGRTMFHKIIESNRNEKEQTLILKTSTGRQILSFYINGNIRCGDHTTHHFEVEILYSQYIPLYNKFIKYCHDNGNKIFSTYMNKVQTFSDHLKLISSIEILPVSKRVIVAGRGYLSISPSAHATIKTPFETITVYKTPHFSLHDGIICLNDKFALNSMGINFTFERITEQNEAVMVADAEYLAHLFYVQHRELIISKLSLFYNVPIKEVNVWSDELIMSYYPVLAMERL